MERRSARGRTSSVSESPPKSKSTPTVVVAEIFPDPEISSAEADVPDISGEEVVLNRRGMPARQRKRNRFYFDEETMITADSPIKRVASRSPGKKIKAEPVDVEEEEETEEIITSDLPDYSFGGEVEIPPSPEEEVADTVIVQTKGRGRPSGSKGTATTRPYNRKSDVEITPKGKGAGSSKNTPKSTQKAHADPISASKPRKSDSNKSKESAGKSPRRSEPATTPRVKSNKSTDKSSRGEAPAKISRAKETESRRKSMDTTTPIKPLARIKKEPDTEADSPPKDQDVDRYAEKREKDRLAKERERKREKEKQQKEREQREYPGSTILPTKCRSKREPSPPMSDFTCLLPTVGQDDLKQAIDKKTAQDISLRLRNLLKLPKAHKWVCYEWFYSNIDKVLFEGENDFQICLKESFPQLKARKLTRVEWCKIRRIMGKPRRCSQAFFDEEREELGRRRQKIRMIQQRKVTDFNYKELPDEIPLQLTIGTKVTARLRRPQDGLFTGTIEGVDTSNNTSRITFDRAGLGTHSIPDYEVLSNDPVETVSTSTFALKIPRRSFGYGTAAFKFQNPGLIGEDGIYRFPSSPFPVDGMLGGFPIRLLDMIVRLSKLLKSKREKILQLKELNVEAEKMRSYSKQYNSDYRMRYARCVLDLDSMNKEMAMYVEGIQTYCLEQILPDHGANQMIIPEQIQEQCRQEANLIVDTYNTKQNRRAVHGTKPVALISQLTSLMLQVKTLSIGGERNLYELKSIKDTIKETKGSLEGKNLQLFQDRVEIPMNRIQAGLCMSTKPY